MVTACASLAALYDVVRCLQRCKIDVANSFASDRANAKVAATYRLPRIGERKHRLFKRYVGPKISKLEGYAKSVLLHLTDMELSNPEPKERWTGQVLGVLREQPETAQRVGLPKSALFASGLEVGCVEFARGTFLRVSKTSCAEVHGCVASEKLTTSFYWCNHSIGTVHITHITIVFPSGKEKVENWL